MSRFWRSIGRKAGKPRQRERWRPRLEALEDRRVPAVTALGGFAGLGNLQGFEPPDTDVAVGPNTVVETVNTIFRISDRTGNPILTQPLNTFFGTGTDFLSDPRVVFDDITDKFYLIVEDFNNPNPNLANVGTLRVAVSAGADPRNGSTDWVKLAVNCTETTSRGQVLTQDYPTLGWNADGLVVTHNMFNQSTGAFTRVQIVAIDNTNQVFIHDGPNGAGDFTMDPVRMHDAAPGGPLWLVEEGTFDGGNTVDLVRMDHPFTAGPAAYTTFTLSVPAYSGADLTPPVQRGGSVVSRHIDSGMLDAAMRGTDLVACHYVSDGREDQVRWYRFDLANLSAPALADEGNVSRGSGVATYVPCIEIAPDHAIGLAFLESSRTEFMSMYVTGRLPTDLAGTMEAPVRVAAGLATYNGSRVGDNSGMALDPSDGTFWGGNEFTGSNGDWATRIAHFTLTGRSLPPTAKADAYAVAVAGALAPDAAHGVLANDTDAESDRMTAVLDGDVSHGTLSLAADGSFTYTPAPSFRGTDGFTYHAQDKDGSSATVAVTIQVGLPPVALDDAYSGPMDTALSRDATQGVLANDTDAEDDPPTAVKLTDPAHGQLDLAADGSFTYTPDPGFHGQDSFTYAAQDQDGTGAPATVTITILGQPPVSEADGYAVAAGGGATLAPDAAHGVLVNDADAEGDPLTAVLDTGVAHGALTLNADGSFSYTPDATFRGADGFTYHARDMDGDGNTVAVTIQVGLPPVPADDSYQVAPGGTLAPDAAHGVLANDTDAENDPPTAVLQNDVTHGTLSLAGDGSFTYTPDPGFQGADHFTYFAQDQDGTSAAAATVTIHVGLPPTAFDDSYGAAAGATLTVDQAHGVLVNDTDPEHDPLSAVLQASPAHGTLSLAADGSFTYTPNSGYRGPDHFTYAAQDVDGIGNTATVSIQVGLPPAAVNDVYRVAMSAQSNVGAGVGVLANDTDPEHDPLTAVLVTGVSHGTLRLNANGSFTYTPARGFRGTDSFTYLVRDQDGDGTVGTVTLTVVGQPPAVRNDTYTATAGTTLTVKAAGVLANDNDAEHDPLTAVLRTPPAHGSLTLNPDGSFTYTPNPGFRGTDTFTYQASDQDGLSSPATVTLRVR